MKINAIIESKDGGTLVLDFPRSIYDVYEKLQSVGIRQSPHQITLSDEEGDDVRVKLYSEDEIGKHFSVDQQQTLITSANLSYHGQQGNIEFGTLIESKQIAKQIDDVFTKLIFAKVFKEI